MPHSAYFGKGFDGFELLFYLYAYLLLLLIPSALALIYWFTSRNKVRKLYGDSVRVARPYATFGLIGLPGIMFGIAKDANQQQIEHTTRSVQKLFVMLWSVAVAGFFISVSGILPETEFAYSLVLIISYLVCAFLLLGGFFAFRLTKNKKI